MKPTPGKGAAILGGALVVVGAVLPWATVHTGAGGLGPVTLSGLVLSYGVFYVFGLALPCFGLLGLALVLIEDRVAAALTVMFGVLAGLMLIPAWWTISWYRYILGSDGGTVSVEYGFYVSLLGAILMVIGGALAMREAENLATGRRIRGLSAQSPPGA